MDNEKSSIAERVGNVKDQRCLALNFDWEVAIRVLEREKLWSFQAFFLFFHFFADFALLRLLHFPQSWPCMITFLMCNARNVDDSTPKQELIEIK